MRNSQVPQNEEEDGWVIGEGGGNEKYLLQEEYLDETPPETRRKSTFVLLGDEEKREGSVRPYAGPVPPDESSAEKTKENRIPEQEQKKEGAKRKITLAKKGMEDNTEESCGPAEAHSMTENFSYVLDTQPGDRETPRVMVNEPQLFSGDDGAKYRAGEEQRAPTDSKDSELHTTVLPLSKAATIAGGGDRDQLTSPSGARSPAFLTDGTTKPLNLNSSTYPQRPSSSSLVNEGEDNNGRRREFKFSASHSKLALFDSLNNGPRIREGVDRLTSLLAGLDEKIEKLVGDHEKDFLLAYRTHMYAIQQQMEYFKRKADEEQAKILRDMKVRSLEKELSWFMSEALRLDGLCKRYQGSLEKWRARAEALAEDRNFLETQIKSCKRQSRALQAKVDGKQHTDFEDERRIRPWRCMYSASSSLVQRMCTTEDKTAAPRSPALSQVDIPVRSYRRSNFFPHCDRSRAQGYSCPYCAAQTQRALRPCTVLRFNSAQNKIKDCSRLCRCILVPKGKQAAETGIYALEGI